MGQIMAHAILNMPETITSEMFAAIPAGDNDEMVFKGFSLEHAQDHHACAGLAVIVLDRRSLNNRSPCVVRGFREFLVSAQRLDGVLNILFRCNRPARDRVFRAPVRNDIVEGLHPLILVKEPVTLLVDQGFGLFKCGLGGGFGCHESVGADQVV